MVAVKTEDKFPLWMLLVVLVVMLWSVIAPKETFTWFLEVFPIFVAVPWLWLSRKRVRFTNLTYAFIALHAIILMVGGHYTYAEVPLGEWMRNWFGFERNHYDRIGHFAQGFIPAMITREILLRRTPLRPGLWLTISCITFPQAISLMYELVEFGVAISTGNSSDAFLGTQGDVWDTQKDMLFATIGAMVAQFTVAMWQNRSILEDLRKVERT